MTRCTAECGTSNSGPICRKVTLVRHNTAIRNTRSDRFEGHCRPGRALGGRRLSSAATGVPYLIEAWARRTSVGPRCD